MADSSQLADLLDRAGKVFSLAGELGRDFSNEHRQSWGQGRIDPSAWRRHKPNVKRFCDAVLDLRDAMQNPPDGFAPVAEPLLRAARIAKEIHDTVQQSDGQTWVWDCFPSLNAVSLAGYQAVKAVAGARRLDDPFAFLDAEGDKKRRAEKGGESWIERYREYERLCAEADKLLNGPERERRLGELHGMYLALRGEPDAAKFPTISPEADILAAIVATLSLQPTAAEAVDWQAWLDHGAEGNPPPAGNDQLKQLAARLAWHRAQSKDGSGIDEAELIARLLDGPGTAELSPRELAYLEAYLKQSVSFAQMQREARSGDQATAQRRAKLKLIRDYNQSLRAQAEGSLPPPGMRSPATPTAGQSEGAGRAAEPRDGSPAGAAADARQAGVADLPPTKLQKAKRGRKRLTPEETRRRNGILSAWKQARDTGVSTKDFCREHQPRLTVKELERIVAWKAARDRRKAGS